MEHGSAKERKTGWFAIRTWYDFDAERILGEECEEVFFPKRTVATPTGKIIERAYIPHLLFVKAESIRLRQLEWMSRDPDLFPFRFWIYRYPDEDRVQTIGEQDIHLLRLLTTDGGEGVEIFHNLEMAKGTRVRITGGKFKGYQGVVRRVSRKRHVLVKIEGVCVVMLPHIHPELLEIIDNKTTTE